MLVGNVPIFAINLEKSRARWISLSDAASTMGLDIHRVPAIDGRALAPENWSGFDRREFERHTGRSVLPGEYGCYRSHLMALRTFLDNGAPYGLVIEDDVLPDHKTAKRVSAIIDALPEFDAVRLVSHRSRLFINFLTTDQGDQVGRTVFGPQGSAAAYLVSREGAQKILSALATMILPWDVALERFWASGAEIFSVKEDVFTFSPHRADSTIITAGGYKDTKFRFEKRFAAIAFQLRDGFTRAHHVLLAPKSAAHLALAENLNGSGAAHGHKAMPALLGAVAVLLFLSAVWFESDTYRVAGGLMVLAALFHYFRSDLYTYSKPLVGLVGFACMAWALYVMARMGFDFAARPGKGFGTAEGIYLLPIMYPTFGYALYLFVRRPFQAVVAFMVISLAVLLLSTDYRLVFRGYQALVSLHNNSIHAANASGFIMICSAAFASHVVHRHELHPTVRKVLIALAAVTFAFAGLNVITLISKGVWVALVISLLPLIAGIAWNKRNLRGSVIAMAVFVLVAAGAGIFHDRVRSVGQRTAASVISLVTQISSGSSLSDSVSYTIAAPGTPTGVRARLMIWSNAAEIWARHPVFGSGIAWLDNWESRKYKESRYTLLHNGYLEIAVRYGITGLMFYAFLFMWSLRMVRKAANANLIDVTAYHAHLAAMIFFAISLFTNSNNRLAFGETYIWFAVSFGFYCQYLLQAKRLIRTNTYF